MKTIEKNLIFLLFLPFTFLGVVAHIIWFHIRTGWILSYWHLRDVYEEKNKTN